MTIYFSIIPKVLVASFVLSLVEGNMAGEGITERGTTVIGRTVPDFGKTYHVKGVMFLPHAEIEESFEAWYDYEGNRSRIDYRDSTVQTFLIGNDLEHGAIYKITPIIPPSVIKCYQLKGTEEEPIKPQSAMPDLQGFDFENMEEHKGVQCEVWKKVTEVGHKMNTYRLWIERPEESSISTIPHRFEMTSFNTLLGAHNDKYIIEYSDFTSETEPHIFTPPEGMACEEFPDPPEEHQILANPMQDYMSTHPVSHAHRMFYHFKQKFDRQYKSEKENEERENYFVQTFRFIQSTNRAGLSFSVGINDRADWSKEEKRKWCYFTPCGVFSLDLCFCSVLLVSERKLNDATPVLGRTPPYFGNKYHVKGLLLLPHSKIEEPFEAWYDHEGNRSRIDYRNGTVRTFLLGNNLDHGSIYKITPILPPSVIKCYQLNGTKEHPIKPQEPMPDSQGFEFEKMEELKGVQCEVWKKITEFGHKKNTYRMWITRPEGSVFPTIPHRFEMTGFNSLLGAHNDKYTIDYSDFKTDSEPDFFSPPLGMTCEAFPDPHDEHQVLANPMQDYVSTHPVSHGHKLFGKFKEEFERKYKDEKENEERENYFLHTFRFVHSNNRAGYTYSVDCMPFDGRTVPEFGKMYHVKGLISLPYAEIKEPFEAWYDLKQKRSRIDYYHGQVSTFFLGNYLAYGTVYKITPVTTETEFNTMKCFQLNGTKEDPIQPQIAVPDVQGFEFEKIEYYRGILCEVWKNVTQFGHKKNTYRLWVTRPESNDSPATPQHYEMMGYNTLLGSHYDKYIVDYSDFSPEVDKEIFNLPGGMSCGNFPGPGVEHHLLANPIQDIMHTSPVGHAHRMFGHYKEKFNRQYENEEEHEEREHNFLHNIRYVHSKNRAGLSFSLSLNHLADRSQEELYMMRGRKKTHVHRKAQPFPTEILSIATPDSVDWRLYGAVTPVKDQAVCGSCWSFATTGTLEGALFLKTGQLTSLSQQMLVDCTWGFGNNGCDGGEEWRAFEWMMKHGGISTAETYGGYMGMNGLCHYNKSSMVAQLSSYTNVTSGDAAALKAAIFKFGPAAVSIDAAHRSFTFYSNGVYYEPECKNGPDDLDHAVLAVGYGTLNNESYWLVKNSWSTYWGNDGYVLMSMKDNNCGVATDATYVTLI
ncbi:hypothetical protein DNTS_033225 [Danionella cerebrum]|uniref:Peptidase C1A papain C-terminal domain-containing protein n=1 Tax=Danionella cerebrum TaxID=2873325 RepID=A0A553RE68_9TELE|nr:hypothetical protein DNTS_033225 [Danionella translucida]